jgi:predicted ATPase
MPAGVQDAVNLIGYRNFARPRVSARLAGLASVFDVQLDLGVSKDAGMVECEVNVAHIHPFDAPRVPIRLAAVSRS